ncbi:hypothetical protein [Salinibacterium sp. ZJ454]|uniref:hypothetical protein n=1 Tax=Salinibacterium sp. ZJ454 TaxID=2708339 RepID=UPI00142270E6|nr:hypothetical protein [Salinibacterium sp. ZJ454]
MSFFYLPPSSDGWTADAALQAGADWLRAQPGPALIIAPDAEAFRGQAASGLRVEFRVLVERWVPFREHDAAAVLVVWPTPRMLGMVSAAGLLAHANTVCVLERGITGWQSAWLRAHQAVDARYETPYPGASVPVLSRVMRVRVREFANGGGSAILRGFGELVDAGHHLTPSAVWAWALAEGYGTTRARLLRNIAMKAVRA